MMSTVGTLQVTRKEALDRFSDLLNGLTALASQAKQEIEPHLNLRIELPVVGRRGRTHADDLIDQQKQAFSKAVVVQHASAFFSTLMKALNGQGESGIGLNPLSGSREPTGWSWIPVRPFLSIGSAEIGGWDFRVHADVVDLMVNACRRSSPRENGGYLYGVLDVHRRRVTIVLASTRPDDCRGSTTFLKLDPEGSTEEERRIRARVGTRLQVVGSWHSHPTSSTRPSGTDVATLVGAHLHNAPSGWPTVGIIVGREEMTVAVIEDGNHTIRATTVRIPE